MERAGAIGGMGAVASSRLGSGSGSSATIRTWDPTRYNVPALATLAGPINGVGGQVGAGDLQWGVLQRFDQGGTITSIGGALGGSTAGAAKVSWSLYEFQQASPMQPGALVHSFQCSGAGANSSYTESVSIARTRGSGLWFVVHGSTSGGDPLNGGTMSILPTQIDAGMGTIWDPATPLGAPTNICGIRHPLTYQYPPPDPFPTISLGGAVSGGHLTDLVLITFAAAIPVFLFQFTPS